MQGKPDITSWERGGFPAAEAWALESPPIHSSLLQPTSHSHLGQTGEEAGTAGGTAADGCEGITEDKTVAGQGIQVRGGDGGVVVYTALKASVIR